MNRLEFKMFVEDKAQSRKLRETGKILALRYLNDCIPLNKQEKKTLSSLTPKSSMDKFRGILGQIKHRVVSEIFQPYKKGALINIIITSDDRKTDKIGSTIINLK